MCDVRLQDMCTRLNAEYPLSWVLYSQFMTERMLKRERARLNAADARAG